MREAAESAGVDADGGAARIRSQRRDKELAPCLLCAGMGSQSASCLSDPSVLSLPSTGPSTGFFLVVPPSSRRPLALVNADSAMPQANRLLRAFAGGRLVRSVWSIHNPTRIAPLSSWVFPPPPPLGFPLSLHFSPPLNGST